MWVGGIGTFHLVSLLVSNVKNTFSTLTLIRQNKERISSDQLGLDRAPSATHIHVVSPTTRHTLTHTRRWTYTKAHIYCTEKHFSHKNRSDERISVKKSLYDCWWTYLYQASSKINDQKTTGLTRRSEDHHEHDRLKYTVKRISAHKMSFSLHRTVVNSLFSNYFRIKLFLYRISLFRIR